MRWKGGESFVFMAGTEWKIWRIFSTFKFLFTFVHYIETKRVLFEKNKTK